MSHPQSHALPDIDPPADSDVASKPAGGLLTNVSGSESITWRITWLCCLDRYDPTPQCSTSIIRGERGDHFLIDVAIAASIRSQRLTGLTHCIPVPLDSIVLHPAHALFSLPFTRHLDGAPPPVGSPHIRSHGSRYKGSITDNVDASTDSEHQQTQPDYPYSESGAPAKQLNRGVVTAKTFRWE